MFTAAISAMISEISASCCGSSSRQLRSIDDILGGGGLATELVSRVERLARGAAGVAIVGSSTVSAFRAPADLDVVAIGHGDRLWTREIDLVWVDCERFESPSWRASEFGSHVLRYAVWVRRPSVVPPSMPPCGRARDAKRSRIIMRMAASRRLLQSGYTHGSRQESRRAVMDALRLGYLAAAQPVPPSTVLEEDVTPETRSRLLFELENWQQLRSGS